MRKYIFWSCFIFSISSKENTKQRIIAPGISYEHIMKAGDHLVSIHEITVDPKQIRFKICSTQSADLQAQSVSQIVKQEKALMGINGSFFDFGKENLLQDALIKVNNTLGIAETYRAFPIFPLKIKDQWFSLANKSTGVIAWSDVHDPIIDMLKITWRLKMGNLIYPVQHINKIHAGAVIYTSAFGTHTPHRKDVTEYIIEQGYVKEIKKQHGRTVIPAQGFIYAVGKKTKKVINIDSVTMGIKASLLKKYESPITHDWELYTYIVGSMPLLLKNSQIQESVITGKTRFYTKRYARTAVGLLPSGNMLFVVIECGIAKNDGMSLRELASYMLHRGCLHALNLDGGGSSTLVIGNILINKPSGREWGITWGAATEIPVANAFLFYAR
jgi:hypothetical protein